MRIRGGFEALSHVCGGRYVWLKRRENFLLLKARGLLCVFFWRRKLEIKYAIEFSCDCFILSVYMLEGE
jgi:hypothetical protein